mmetsp:Transcript_27942/g.57387  ORF Transcript_27942/g.57387 Transcript_27942/m.57387 type:complete len:417 (+) Transcript_27942:125-1375(+)
MGANQSSIEENHRNPTLSPLSKESFGDMRESDLLKKAENKYRPHLNAMRDAYGDQDGYHIFKLVVLSPQKYQVDNRRLIQTLAREAIVGLEGFGASATEESKLGVMKSGLVFIYDNLDGVNWRQQSPGWSPSQRQAWVSSWLGVSIEGGLFTGLKLMQNQLKGDVSRVLEKLGALESLGGICALQEINMASNALDGELNPSVISQFTSLVVFCLAFNSIYGEVPPTFCECEGLAILNLQGNRLVGQIPPTLGRCSNLRVLHLYSNALTGPLPAELSELSNLVELRVWDNRLTGALPPSYSALGRLKVLHLANNSLSGQVLPDMLLGMQSLEYLFLNNNRFTGPVPVTALASLPALKSVHLSHNSFFEINAAFSAMTNAIHTSGRNVEVDMLGKGFLYVGNECPEAEKGSVSADQFS